MKFVLPLMMFALVALPAFAQEAFEKDVIKTSAGDLDITFIGHGSLMMRFGSRTIHVDPFSKLADYAKLPKADLVLITHEHQDHLDPAAIDQVRTKDTKLVLTEKCAEKLSGGTVMKNGDVQTVLGITIEAVPAYNLVHKRENGQPFHPKGQGSGYVLTFGDKRVYIAFLPMNLPYTMTPEMVADAARAFKPGVLYPYHYGETAAGRINAVLKDTKDIEVRIRKMK